MIEIRPDPAHPRGGYAVVVLDGAGIAEAEVSLTIYNSYTEQYLGADGWQATKAFFGPYAVDRDGERIRFVVGPEIVNGIDDDTPVRIAIGEESFDTYWPEDINAAPGAAVIGGISATAAKASGGAGPRLVEKMPEPEPDPAPVEAEAPPVPEPAPVPPPPKPAAEPREGGSSNKGLLVAGGVALIAAVAAAAWFFLRSDEVAVVPPAPVPAPAPVPVETSACSAEALGGLRAEQGFAGLAEGLRACGTEVSADDALLAIEAAVDANDPGALAFFGALYDDGVTDEVVEGTIGLTFPDNPARAAEYYARAKAAGSDDGAQRLTAICRKLLLMSDTLSQSAHEDHCN